MVAEDDGNNEQGTARRGRLCVCSFPPCVDFLLVSIPAAHPAPSSSFIVCQCVMHMPCSDSRDEDSRLESHGPCASIARGTSRIAEGWECGRQRTCICDINSNMRCITEQREQLCLWFGSLILDKFLPFPCLYESASVAQNMRADMRIGRRERKRKIA